MRLLITGWQGQLARALVELVPARDDVSSFSVGRPTLDASEHSIVQRAMADSKPDVIINAAAYTAVDEAETDREAAFASNRDGARMLAEAAANRDIPIVHISTDYVFDGTLDRPYREDDAPNPQTVYGRSKLEGEQAVIAANPKHIILRTSWIYSASGTNFVRSMLSKAEAGGTIDVVNDQHGSPTYAPDLAATVIDIAARIPELPANDPAWGIYHVAGAGEATWFDLATEVMSVSAVSGGSGAKLNPIVSADYPTRAPRLANARLDCSKLEARFGLRVPPWRDGVKACLARIAQDNGTKNETE